MKRTCFIPTILALLLFPVISRGQAAPAVEHPEKVPAGFSWAEWTKMEKRWQPYSTRVSIQKKDGTLLEGQLTWADAGHLMIQTNQDLPVGILKTDEHILVPVAEIAVIKVRYGGHPFKGMIYGMLGGAIPGAVTGLILAQGWTVIPAIVFGAVTSAGGGTVGSLIQKSSRKQTIEIENRGLPEKTLAKLKKTALFPGAMPERTDRSGGTTLHDFEQLVGRSPMLQRAFPVNPWSLSVHASVMTNSVRKRMQNWYMSPLFGPSDPYYETRIGLTADLSRNLGKRFQAGALIQLFPGDISSSFFDNYRPDWNVYYSYNHHFKQTTAGIYGGWLLHPASRYWATRMEASIQAGVVLSDIYEHFYFQWNAIDQYTTAGETFIRKHYLQPGGFLRTKASWYLIPGFSIDAGLEGYWIKRISFPDRTVLPETTYGPAYIGQHRLNFSNLQGFLGVSVHW